MRALRSHLLVCICICIAALCAAGCNEILAINPPADEVLVPDAGNGHDASTHTPADLLDADADGGQ